MNKDEIRLMQNAAVALERKNAEVLRLKASSRGDRLRKSEKDVKDAAKPKTRAGRGIALKLAEGEIASREPKDARLCFAGMTRAAPKPAKPVEKAAIVRAYRDAIAARR